MRPLPPNTILTTTTTTAISTRNNLNQADEDYTNTKTPGCTNPPNYQTATAFIDSAASISLVGQRALCKIAAVQEKSKILGIPNRASMATTQTVELLLTKLLLAARKAYRVPNIAHNEMIGSRGLHGSSVSEQNHSSSLCHLKEAKPNVVGVIIYQTGVQ